jgi:hypothetical protein
MDSKPIPRTLYVLDYKLFLNVVKWKLMMMDRNIRRRIERDMDSHGYICPQCQRKYTALEAQARTVMFVNASGQQDFQFVCDAHPDTSLDEDKNDDIVKQGNSHLNLLNLQNKPLLDLVYSCDHLKLPAYNAALVLEQMSAIKKENKEAALLGSDGLPMAAGDQTTASVLVEFTADGEGERKRAEELREKREKNKLPVWYQYSTVTGEEIMPNGKPKEKQQAAVIAQNEDEDDYYKEYLTQVTSAAGSVPDLSAKRPRDDQSGEDLESEPGHSVKRMKAEGEGLIDEFNDEDDEFAYVSSLGDYELTAEDQAVLRECGGESSPELNQVDVVSGKINSFGPPADVEDEDDEDDEFQDVPIISDEAAIYMKGWSWQTQRYQIYTN